MKYSFYLFTFFVSFSAIGASVSELPLIKKLDYSDPQLKKIRAEVHENIRLFSNGENIQITWRKYRLKKKDSFFLVMARTALNHDTLSSVNRLSSLWDITEGDTWLIPNMRGIAIAGDKNSIVKKYKTLPSRVFSIPGISGFYFVQGLHFDDQEKNWFNLSHFIHPVKARVSSQFGVRTDPFNEKKKFHKGIDLACPIGTKVVASAGGKVVFSGTKKGYGKTVIIEHRNGYQTLYGHLSKPLAKKGEIVKQGQKIALSGNTGRSTGPHLHFEVRRKGRPEKPFFHKTYLSKR